MTTAPVPGFEPFPPADDRYDSHEGNARRLAADHGERLRYCEGRAGFLVWDGARWRDDHLDEATRLAVDSAARFGDSAGARWARTSAMAGTLAHTLRLARSIPPVPVRAEELDRPAHLINLPNGTLVLPGHPTLLDAHPDDDERFGRPLLREHRPADLLTKVAGAESHDGVPWDVLAPRWKAFLGEVMPDPELQTYLRDVVGYALAGTGSERAFFVFHGNGRNGKSVFLATVRMLFGDYATWLPETAVMAGKNRPERNDDLVDLSGARVALLSETEEGERLSPGRLKRLTGGGEEATRARVAYARQYVDVVNKAVLVMATNHRPTLSDFSEGMRERVKLVPWEATIPEDRQRPMDALLAEFAEELPGILAWAIDGYLAWVQGPGGGRLSEPEVVRLAVAEYFDEEDVLGAFVREALVEDADAWTPWSEVHAAYSRWAFGRDEERLSQRQLTSRLKPRYGQAARQGTRGVHGFRVPGAEP
jgi:putative DNA primase/helicase